MVTFDIRKGTTTGLEAAREISTTLKSTPRPVGGGRGRPPSISEFSELEKAGLEEGLIRGANESLEAFKSRLQSAGLKRQSEQALIEKRKVEQQIKTRELAAKTEQERIEKARAGTIAGQLEARPTVVEAIEPRKGLLGRAEFALRGKRFVGTKAEKFLSGVGTSLLGTAIFAKELVKAPIRTTIGVAKAIPRIPEAAAKIGPLLRTETEFATGFVAGEVLTLKGLGAAPKGVTKVSDILRTRGLKELKATDIIAPEFFKGQTFPQIRKGQTAKELLEEFKPVLPGETRPAGFTATPKPFPKETEALRGTSEFPGVFQAPRVSPRFLRISGEAEKKLFSTKVFDTFRPTIVRVTPKEFRLVPAVKPGQRVLSPAIKETQRFFETAPKDISFVPFIKTEKEAIIPFGTKLQKVDTRFFVKFEGRRVPIAEFETRGAAIDRGIKKLPTIEKVSKDISKRRIGRPTGEITPISSVTFAPSRRALAPPTRIRIVPPSQIVSRPIPETIKGGPTTPSIISRPSRIRITELPSVLKPSVSLPKRIDITKKIPGKKIKKKFEEKKKIKKVKKLKKPKPKALIRPSLTGIILEIEAPAIISPKFGVTPGQIRGLRTGFKKPRKKKNGKQ